MVLVVLVVGGWVVVPGGWVGGVGGGREGWWCWVVWVVDGAHAMQSIVIPLMQKHRRSRGATFV